MHFLRIFGTNLCKESLEKEFGRDFELNFKLRSSFTKSYISQLNPNDPEDVFSVDFDLDGDMDILSANFNNNRIYWHKN